MSKPIQLGAPSLIDGRTRAQATITAQTLMRLRELSLAEGSTEEGNIVTASKLMGQLSRELSAQDAEGYKVAFVDAESKNNHYNTTSGTMWKTGIDIKVSGLRLMHDSGSGYVPVDNSQVFWSISELEEGEWPVVNTDGSIIGNLFVGKVRGALKSDPMIKADLPLYIGLDNVNASGNYNGKPCPIAAALNADRDSYVIPD